MKLLLLLITTFILLATTAIAGSGNMPYGFTLKSRHMGGTGVGYYISEVDAYAENPAGMGGGRLKTGDLVLDFGITNTYADVRTTNGVSETYHRNQIKRFHVPQLGVVYKLAERVSIGMGVIVSAASGSDYKDNIAKSNAESEVASLRTGPSVAVKILDNLTIGGGPALYYTMAKANSVHPVLGTKTDYPGDDSYDLGGTLGIFFGPWRNLTVGANYNSGATAMISDYGDMTMDGIADAIELGIPGDISFGVGYKLLGGKLGLTVEYKQVFWSKAEFYKDLGWTDSRVYALGAEYQLLEKWILRAGVNYGKTPIQDVSGETGLEVANLGSYATTKQTISAFNALGHNGSEWHFAIGTEYKYSAKTNFTIGYVNEYKNESIRNGTGIVVAPATMGTYNYKSKGQTHSIDMGITHQF